MSQDDLFSSLGAVPEGAANKPVRERKRGSPQRRGYANPPGTGPEGETCGTCKHHVIKRMSRRYHKCYLTRQTWTGGQGSDILVRAPACKLWEREED